MPSQKRASSAAPVSGRGGRAGRVDGLLAYFRGQEPSWATAQNFIQNGVKLFHLKIKLN